MICMNHNNWTLLTGSSRIHSQRSLIVHSFLVRLVSNAACLFHLIVRNQITPCSASTAASGWSSAPSPGWEGRTPSRASPTWRWAPSASSWAWSCSSSTTNTTPATPAPTFRTKSPCVSSPSPSLHARGDPAWRPRRRCRRRHVGCCVFVV